MPTLNSEDRYLNERGMHGNVLRKIDTLRDALKSAGRRVGLVVHVNRMYLTNEAVMLNITVDRDKYLVAAYDDDYEVSQFNRKTCQTVKHRVSCQQIQNGSFLESFVK